MAITQVPSGAVFATLLGFLAATIVIAATFRIPLPIIASDRHALFGVVGIGLGMCIAGGWAAEAAIPTGPTSVIASVAGILCLVVLVAVVSDWSAVLDPIAGVFFGTTARGIGDRVGVLAIGVLIAVAWTAATLRQVGLAAGG